MEKINMVSLWVGKSESTIELKKYIKENYNDDGEMSSKFMEDFGIVYYDNQFIEVLFTAENNKNNIFKDFSYSENFINVIDSKNFNDFNSYILLYNFDYEESKTESKNFSYLGTYKYR